jgi:enamine deaminase RidA (YjgF/YER057c/UK114 family)
VKIGHWRPAPSVVGADACATAITDLGQLDLLTYTAWRYDSPTYIDNLYHLCRLLQSGAGGAHVGVADFDLPHLKLLVGSGYPIVANTVAASLLDERYEEMLDYCRTNEIAVIGYGATLGGLVGEEWVGKPEPKDTELQGEQRRWKRVIDAAGGWGAFQGVLSATASVAKKHHTSLAAVAVRHVLDSGVAAVSLPAPVEGVLELKLDADDRCMLACSAEHLPRLPGGCGDELRFAPFLTASGEMPSEALTAWEQPAKREQVEALVKNGGRVEYMSGSPWEPVVGYCRSVRHRDRIVVSGTTTKPHPSGRGVVGADAEDQATFVFDIIRGAIAAVGGTMADVVRTRILYADVERDWLAVGRVQEREIMARHGVLPTNTMVGGLTYVVGKEALLEIEAECVMGAGAGEVLRLDPRDL